jgi:hypothetical protein
LVISVIFLGDSINRQGRPRNFIVSLNHDEQYDKQTVQYIAYVFKSKADWRIFLIVDIMRECQEWSGWKWCYRIDDLVYIRSVAQPYSKGYGYESFKNLNFRKRTPRLQMTSFLNLENFKFEVHPIFTHLYSSRRVQIRS